jgi:hypothetical protein
MNARAREERTSRRSAILSGTLGGAAGVMALAGCRAAETSPPTTTARSAITGTGIADSVFSIAPGGVSPCASQIPLNATPPSAFAGRVWIALDPYTPLCEVLAVTGVGTNLVDVSPSPLLMHHGLARVAFLEEGTVTPQLFGAQVETTGATPADSALFFQNAINALARLVGTGTSDAGSCSPAGACPSQTCTAGGTLFLPRGTYTIGQTLNLPEHINVRGDGPASILAYGGNDVAIVWQPTDPQIVGIVAALSSFQIRSSAPSTVAAIRIHNAYSASVEDVVIDGNGGTGFTRAGIVVESGPTNASVVTILGSTVQGVAGDGVQVSWAADASGSPFTVSLRSCRITSNRGWAVNVDPPQPGAPTIQPAMLLVDGNLLEQNGLGQGANDSGLSGGITGGFIGGAISNNFWSEAAGQRSQNFLWINQFFFMPHDPPEFQPAQGFDIANNIAMHGPSSAAPSIYCNAVGGFGAAMRGNVLFPGPGALGAATFSAMRHARAHANWTPNLPVLCDTVSPPNFYASLDYGLSLRTYRFRLASVGGTAGPSPVPLSGDASMTSYILSDAGQVVAMTAYSTGSLGAGSITCTVASPLVAGSSPLSVVLAGAPANSVAVPTLQTTPTFARGAALAVNFVASGVPDVDLVVEVMVAFGQPGGGTG